MFYHFNKNCFTFIVGPISQAPLPRSTQPVNDTHCLICLDAAADTVLYQCGHLCLVLHLRDAAAEPRGQLPRVPSAHQGHYARLQVRPHAWIKAFSHNRALITRNVCDCHLNRQIYKIECLQDKNKRHFQDMIRSSNCAEVTTSVFFLAHTIDFFTNTLSW